MIAEMENMKQYLDEIYSKLTDEEKVRFKKDLSLVLDFEGSDLPGFLDEWDRKGDFNDAKEWLKDY